MKRKNLKNMISGVSDKKTEPRIPKRKSNKGCYIDPHELGILVSQYIDMCSDPKYPCIRKCKSCAGDIRCKNRIIKCEGKLSEYIWLMANNISTVWTFRKVAEIVKDLPSLGYLSAVAKLKNMAKKDFDSAFSYLTTVIKNAYRAYKKDHNEYTIMKMILEIDAKHHSGDVE